MEYVYMVACVEEVSTGRYNWAQATKRFFASENAALAYADTVAASRLPIIVRMGRRTINSEYLT